jgi:3-oxosteroid 1-dehydrogenase
VTSWDHTTDLLVMGSGGGAMTTALVADCEGLDALLLEKSERYGGSTALSAGGIWVPNNHLMAKAGIPDSPEDARTYMRNTVGDRVPWARQRAYLDTAPEMLRYLTAHSHVEYQIMPGYTDYYPERPGGTMGGRGLEPTPFNGRKLGAMFDELRAPPRLVFGGIMITAAEVPALYLMRSAPLRSLWTLLKLSAPYFLNLPERLAGRRGMRLTMGNSLLARLRLSLRERDVPLWLNTTVEQLLVEDGRVVGARARRGGEAIQIRARRGVVLAAGGFARNQEMRRRYQRPPTDAGWTLANPNAMGDAIRMGLALGADVDLMEDAWWMPTSLPPGEAPYLHVGERALPGGIMVDSSGRRFTNEAASYIDVVHAMYGTNGGQPASIPVHFVMDQRFRDKYPFGPLMPGFTQRKYLDNGYLERARTLEELAEKIGVDPQGLLETVERFNDFARTGKDLDFGKGDSAYDRYYGDPKAKPNPCLAPIEKPPYYAVEIFPGDLGTKGGLITDSRARVCRADGSVIDGLYAIGNTAASVMGNTYPGPGSTIGPALTFGYIAARDAAG